MEILDVPGKGRWRCSDNPNPLNEQLPVPAYNGLLPQAFSEQCKWSFPQSLDSSIPPFLNLDFFQDTPLESHSK
jgi:hypothetical protein